MERQKSLTKDVDRSSVEGDAKSGVAAKDNGISVGHKPIKCTDFTLERVVEQDRIKVGKLCDGQRHMVRQGFSRMHSRISPVKPLNWKLCDQNNVISEL